MTRGYLTRRGPSLRPPVTESVSGLHTRQGTTIVTGLRHLPGGGVATRPERFPEVKNHTGYIIGSWTSRFYNRIVITPPVVTLGAVSAAQRIRVKVWNAWLVSQTLTAITITGGEGITLGGPALPLRFNRLALHTWQLDVSADGPDVIDCQVTWSFAGLPPVTLAVTGSRTVSWLMTPDWSDSLTETLEWKTDVHQSQTGAMQRVARRLSPRRMFEFRVTAQGAHRQRLEQQLYRYASRTWTLPVFPDAQLLNVPVVADSLSLPVQSEGRDFRRGGMALICHGDLFTRQRETVEIGEITDHALMLARPLQHSWPAGSQVIPLRSARLTDPARISRLSDGVLQAQVRFMLSEHSDFSTPHGLPVYRHFPVLEPGSDWSRDLTSELQHLMASVDNDTGIVFHQDMAGRPFVLQSHHWLMSGRHEQSRIRALLYYLRGRQRPLWVSSQCSDMEPVNNINGSHVDIAWAGISDDGPLPGRQDIRIETTLGVFYARMTAAVLLNDHQERLSLDCQLSISRDDILKMSWLSLCIQGSDSVAWEHKTDSAGVASLSLTFQGVRDELE